jgi:hypothetical protein
MALDSGEGWIGYEPRRREAAMQEKTRMVEG